MIDFVSLLRKKREAAIRDANSFAILIANLDKDAPASLRTSVELVERMFSHNVAILDDALQNIEETYPMDSASGF